MPPTDPKYVRLADKLASRSITDISGRSGWSISGNEVKEFPPKSKPKQQRFVRQKLAQGMLETCSKSEWEEMNKLNTRYDELVHSGAQSGGHQESIYNDAADQARAEVFGDEAAEPDSTDD